MNRRLFLSGLVVTPLLLARLKKFYFKIKTKDKSIIGVTIEGKDAENAKYKLNKRYPGCTIIEMKEK